jgi:hypothetical protein
MFWVCVLKNNIWNVKIHKNKIGLHSRELFGWLLLKKNLQRQSDPIRKQPATIHIPCAMCMFGFNLLKITLFYLLTRRTKPKSSLYIMNFMEIGSLKVKTNMPYLDFRCLVVVSRMPLRQHRNNDQTGSRLLDRGNYIS